MKNIFIEGMQGSGKTTLMRALNEKLEGYDVYFEGDISPVELAWCSFMSEEEYHQTLDKFPTLISEIEKHTVREDNNFIVEYTRILTDLRGFHHYMEKYEIYNGRRTYEEFKDVILTRFHRFQGTGNLFECSFFQNIMEELILFYCKSEKEIFEFYREIFDVMKQKDFRLLYLYSDDIKGNVLQIKKERTDINGVEMWFPLMMKYLNDSFYGREHRFVGISDMIVHFEKRMYLEVKIVKEILGEYSLILPAKEYEIENAVNWIG